MILDALLLAEVDGLDPMGGDGDLLWAAPAAGAVLEGAESFLSRHPQVGQVADLTAMRARIAEIDESLDIARDWADQLRAERDHLVSQSGPLRRGLIAGVD